MNRNIKGNIGSIYTCDHPMQGISIGIPEEQNVPFLQLVNVNVAAWFVDGVIPEVGDKVEMVCTQSGGRNLSIKLRVVK